MLGLMVPANERLIHMDTERLSIIAETAAEKERVLTMFFIDADTHIRQMRYALQHSDRQLFVEMAHSMRGAAANLGMNTLASLCGEAMRVTKILKKENKELLNRINAEIISVRNYLVTIHALPPYE